jgi:polyphosphate kinase
LEATVASAPDARSAADLGDPALYINRETSQLDFNARVLAQAGDAGVPLLERLRFLTICSTNLDEFFEIRVSGFKQQKHMGVSQAGPDGLGVDQTLAEVAERAHRLVAEQYRVLNAELLPALERENVRLVPPGEWSAAQREWIQALFKREMLPVLSPMGLDPAHPFPRVANKSLNLIVRLEGKDAFGRSSGLAVVPLPRTLPRLTAFPREVARGPHDFALLSWIVSSQIGELFPGMEVVGAWPFRLTRNSELWVEEEEVDDLLQALEGELPRRNFGDAVRLELLESAPEDIAAFLLAQFGLGAEDLYRVPWPVNLLRLAALHDAVDRPELKYRPFVAGLPRQMAFGRDLFAALRDGDVLLHHPYQSFGVVVDLVRQAAADPDVLAIKQTLYRTGGESPLVDALIDAARAGKEVTAVVELRARFDEQRNIDLATRLHEAGANVVYGVVGHKTHAKMLLVVRREGKRLRRYVHLGTGNYHPGTARVYTDLSLLSSAPELGEDVANLFLQLTGLGRATRLKRLLQAPFSLYQRLLELIEREAEAARAGKLARIVARMNSLCEPGIIRALYRASQAGVKVDLVVRGICSLRPGIPGVSENIRVRSIVGRFLEHSRLVYFYSGGEELVYASSADWMQRNFFRRVEVAFPIEDQALRSRAIAETLAAALADNQQAWSLASDGTWRRETAGANEALAAQETLLRQLAESSLQREPEPDLAQRARLLGKVGQRERVRFEPARRKAERQRGLARPERDGRGSGGAAPAVQEHGEAQDHGQAADGV